MIDITTQTLYFLMQYSITILLDAASYVIIPPPTPENFGTSLIYTLH